MVKYRAFTLIELLLSLGLLALILFFSIPNEASLHKKNQIQIRCDDIKNAISYAKTRALTKGYNVIITPLYDSNDWSHGMLLCTDNTDHRCIPNVKPIHQWHWKRSGINIDWRGFQSNRYLLFSADSSKNTVNGTFTLKCDSQYSVQLVLNRWGRIKRNELWVQ